MVGKLFAVAWVVVALSERSRLSEKRRTFDRSFEFVGSALQAQLAVVGKLVYFQPRKESMA